MRDLAHYTDMLDRNPHATVGINLAELMVLAAGKDGGKEDDEDVWRALKRKYGEHLTNAECRAEMGVE